MDNMIHIWDIQDIGPMAVSSTSLLAPLFLGTALNILCPLVHFSGYIMTHVLPLSLWHYQSSDPQRTMVL